MIRVCSDCGSSKRHEARGLCRACYKRHRYVPTPPPTRLELTTEFLAELEHIGLSLHRDPLDLVAKRMGISTRTVERRIRTARENGLIDA